MTDDERGRELVERVARAIYGARFGGAGDWDQQCAPSREFSYHEARAAIAAMREGEQKQESEARAARLAGETGLSTVERLESAMEYIAIANRQRDALIERVEAAESLAKAEREGRESEGEAERLREAILRVLDDDESQPGGWGPDVTMQGVLREALDTDAGEQRMRDADEATKRIQDERDA